MTRQEIEAAVLNIIERAYEAKYIGKLKIEYIEDCNKKVIGFKLILSLNNVERPITIQMEGSIQNFLKYIEKEFRSRHLHYTSFYTGYKVPIEDNCNSNTLCKCEK